MNSAEEKGRLWLLTACLAAVIFLSVDGLIQYVFGRDILGHELYGDRLTGPYKRPTLGMTIANLFTPVIFWLLSRKQNLKSIFLANACYAAIFLSGDRMGLVFASLVMIVWFLSLMCVSKRRLLALALNLCFFAVLFGFSPHLAERQIQSTAATAEALPSSPYGLVWKSAWHVGKAHPLFGVGMRQFRHACLDENFGPSIDPKSGASRCYTHPHNHYMEWFSEEGVVGLLGFVGFVVAAVSVASTLRESRCSSGAWAVFQMGVLVRKRFQLRLSVSFTPEQRANGGVTYNYQQGEFPSEEAPAPACSTRARPANCFTPIRVTGAASTF